MRERRHRGMERQSPEGGRVDGPRLGQRDSCFSVMERRKGEDAAAYTGRRGGEGRACINLRASPGSGKQ